MADRLLLLGGTTEARALAGRLADQPAADVVYSLADATPDPIELPVPVRRGGFGGIPGLVDYLRERQVSAVIDATHPFAAQMTRHALAACRQLNLPCLRLVREPWQSVEGDRWFHVADVEGAAKRFATLATRGFLTLGVRYWTPFLSVPDTTWLVRAITPPSEPVDQRVTVILDRGPFSLTGERSLLVEHRIECIVTRNSGGDATRAKLDAARELGLPVVMIERPFPEPGHAAAAEVTSVDDALGWLARRAQA